MPNYADSLVNGIMSVASPTDDGSGKFTISQEDPDTLLTGGGGNVQSVLQVHSFYTKQKSATNFAKSSLR